MLNWLRKNKSAQQLQLTVDIHSHFLPALDDGVQTFDEAADILSGFAALGYKKIITTPHVISDTYRNTPKIILGKLDELRNYLVQKNISIQIDAAAEYYLDEDLTRKIESSTDLLTFGDNYLLFETNFMTEPLNLKEFIFMASSRGYRLVLAHPERYVYMQQDVSKFEDLHNRGILFQVNTSSFTGYYSKGAQRAAQFLTEKGWVHFVGSDCHNLQQFNLFKDVQANRYFRKALTLPLLNNSLL